MTTLKLTIAYNGTHFKGWQYQPKMRTVQGVLEKTIQKVLGEPIKVTGASRTDAGVHAIGQVVRVQYHCSLLAENFQFVMNRALPDDIVIKSVEEVSVDFHPIAHTESKIYHYTINNAPLRDPFKESFSWYVREPVIMDRVNEAIKIFLGEHDFQSFCAAGSIVKSTVRTIYSIEIIQKNPDDFVFTFHGNGFLYNMIRIITAVLIRVGQGKMTLEEVEHILVSKNRNLVPWTAPAHGLCLISIFYEKSEEVFE